ncbi:MAG: inorganic phosphate transporter [Campylobacterota bacterium]
MDMKTVRKVDKFTRESQLGFARLSLALLFVFAVFIYSYYSHGGIEDSKFLIIGAVFGAYMAMNIGANDVANNVGPAVGSRALTIFWAIVIAAVFEAMGAIVAGGDVVGTIKKGIIDPGLIDNPEIFIWAMTASLLAAALWLNFATSVGAPVSTTHSIVGGVMGSGIAAAGFAIVAWDTVGAIVASWVISPVLGGVIAAGFMYFIKKKILYQKDMIAPAKKFVPVLISIMSWAFVTYLLVKGVKKILVVSFPVALIVGLLAAAVVYYFLKPYIAKKARELQSERKDINSLFTIPLIFSAALLSFAHGANDVANAIGPLAAINDAVMAHSVNEKVSIPFWVLAVGAFGLSVGLALYGPKLIRTVGSEITELDQMRAFCIALAAAITVIIASQLGLPVSSTHIALGGVFGVGFLREWLNTDETVAIDEQKRLYQENKQELKAHEDELRNLVDSPDKDKQSYERIVTLYQLIEEKEKEVKAEKKDFKQAKKVQYVKRDTVKKIIAAWIITVPAAGLLSAGIFFMIKGIMVS